MLHNLQWLDRSSLNNRLEIALLQPLMRMPLERVLT
jgi:hypothetical protein